MGLEVGGGGGLMGTPPPFVDFSGHIDPSRKWEGLMEETRFLKSQFTLYEKECKGRSTFYSQ